MVIQTIRHGSPIVLSGPTHDDCTLAAELVLFVSPVLIIVPLMTPTESLGNATEIRAMFANRKKFWSNKHSSKEQQTAKKND